LAAITYGHVVDKLTVFHENAPNAGVTTTTVMDGDANGGVFSTYSGKAGVVANFSDVGGSITIHSFGSRNLGEPINPGYNYEDTHGTMDFAIFGGTVTPSVSGFNPGTGAMHLKITDLSNGAFWRINADASNFNAPPIDGTLTSFGSGSYRMAWDTTESYLVGTTLSGVGTVNLTFVPEPASLTLLALATPALGRRRR
jgi:hypothetical protein